MNKVGSDALLINAETMRVIYKGVIVPFRGDRFARSLNVIYNSFIPFKGFVAINLFGTIYVRKDNNLTQSEFESMIVHEGVHTMQMIHDGYVRFYTRYLWEYLRGLVRYKNTYLAYRNVSYEQEAYNN